MNWAWHDYLAPLSIFLWVTGAFLAIRDRKYAPLLVLAGAAVTLVFIVGLWIRLERPPMRTMGETRLWYSFFLSAAGLLAFKRWKYSWLLAFTAILASVFAVVNLVKPEIHSRTLMPALQSAYFVPHVTMYMLSYAVLAASAVGSFIQLRNISRSGQPDPGLYDFIDNVVYVGLGFLALGLIIGAAWAKAAWGHYWSWDPKETWALITLAAFLLYIHLRLSPAKMARPKLVLMVPPVGLILLLITWLGVSYLPAAQASVHVY
ncbi:MAG: cytochrome c biogenesis protein CcsA [Deltaproteobacteria bacterium]|jgi:ABC-type transport system involved in cytochrome c biogenesis permease subunit|nr:cytochrome c biogenesis protein CcsA [Deltaproteobacteria bacterium]